MERSKSKMKTALKILAGFAIVLAVASFILYSIQKVRSGHGLDYYITGHGVQMNYIGVLIAFGTLAIALLIGWIIRIWSNKKRGCAPDRLHTKILKKDRT